MDRLVPLLVLWKRECNAEAFGLTVDIGKMLQEMRGMVSHPECALLVMEEDGRVAGFMGLIVFVNPFGNERILNEHYWYVAPEFRGKGYRFLKEAERWAREKGCSHLMLNASRLASGLHDKVCRLYEAFGMERYESTYLKKIGG